MVATIRTHLRSFKDVETSGSVSIGLRAIVNATETAGTLSQQLQAIGEMTPVFPDQVDVHELLNDVRRHVSDQVWLHVVPKAERSSIRTDRASLRQGLTNLVLSFRYTMPEGSLVAIATRNVVVPPNPRTPANPPIPRSTSSPSRSPTPVAADPKSWIGACSSRRRWRRRGAILLSLVILHDIVSYAGGFIEVASTAAGATTVNVYLQL